MREILEEFLKKYRKKTILLSDLEKAAPGDISYYEFAAAINDLIDRNILKKINPKNNNGKSIPLCMKYGVNGYELKKGFIDEIRKLSLQVNDEINLEDYYKMKESEFLKDKEYILKINEYLSENGLPESYVTIPERSFNIIGDEKWIDEKGGKNLLKRLKIYDKLKIAENNDPLMFAVNKKCINDDIHYHLIVENKATFLALMEHINETEFTSIILGYGWKITGNIFMLKKQLELNGKDIIYYFGDLDNEGISIFNSLFEKVNVKIPVKLADEFYRELLKKSYSRGKENQVYNENAVERFAENFESEERKLIKYMLKNGYYMPQEALDKDELVLIAKRVIKF